MRGTHHPRQGGDHLFFLLFALGHLCRLAITWEVVLAGWAVPFAVSWAALFIFAYWSYECILAYLSYEDFRLSKKSP